MAEVLATMASLAYRFGTFRLDPASRDMRRGDEDLSLPLKVFDCVVYLVENRDRAVGRDELIEAVWGDVHLSDSVLGQAILLARKALDDTGEEQQVIKTVRGFGYRWVAVTEPEVVEVDVAKSHDHAESVARPRPAWLWPTLAILVAGALAAGVAYLRRGAEPSDPNAAAPPPAIGEIAILLPVRVEAGEGHAWVRLGLMDLIAERLRAAGQAMVPSDTVIALLGGAIEISSPEDIDRLVAATGARLVLNGYAEVAGTRWTVSLRSLQGAQPPLTAVAEATDVLAAARASADRMAAALGLTPATDPDLDHSLQMLLQQIRAAKLAHQMDVARTLIEGAEPRLRRHPEIRFQEGAVEYDSHHLDAAQESLEPLLEETPAGRDPVLRARILNGLAVVHGQRGDWDTAEPILQEAARLLAGQDTLATLGLIRTNLGGAALERGDVDAAWEQVAQARRIYQGIGDVQNLATLDLLLGVLEARRERFAEALYYFESAADRHAAVGDVGGELHARAYVMAVHLELLDPPTASTHEPRVNQLLAETTSPMLAAIANLTRIDLLDADGRSQAAGALLTELTSAAAEHKDLSVQRMEALVWVAERAARAGDAEGAVHAAREVVDQLAQHPTGQHDAALGRAWLALARAELSLGNLAAAAMASAALTDLARRSRIVSPTIYAALVQAELAAAEGGSKAAETAFETAFGYADAGRVPRQLLEVAQSYVPWLLIEVAHGTMESGRALRVADRVARYADRHYGAALLQLRVYHALGPPSAWRAALARSRSLAGERQIPPELLTAPPPDGEARSPNADLQHLGAPLASASAKPVSAPSGAI